MQLNLYEHICSHIVTKVQKGFYLLKTQPFPVLFFGVVVEKIWFLGYETLYYGLKIMDASNFLGNYEKCKIFIIFIHLE